MKLRDGRVIHDANRKGSIYIGILGGNGEMIPVSIVVQRYADLLSTDNGGRAAVDNTAVLESDFMRNINNKI
jgi:hypothetical protein